MENMTGVNETAQIVKVTYDGADRFYSVSGKVLSSAKNMSLEMLQLFKCVRLIAKNSLESDKKRESLEFNAGSLNINKDSISAFDKYMKDNNLNYSIVSEDAKGNINVCYKKKDAVLVDSYVSGHRGSIRYTTIADISQKMTATDLLKGHGIPMEGKTAVEIDKSQIVSRENDTVKIKSVTGKEYIELQHKDLFKIKDSYCIRVDKDMGDKINKLYGKSKKISRGNGYAGRTFKYKDLQITCRPKVNHTIKQVKSKRR